MSNASVRDSEYCFVVAIAWDSLGYISKTTNGKVEATDFILGAVVSSRSDLPMFSPQH